MKQVLAFLFFPFTLSAGTLLDVQVQVFKRNHDNAGDTHLMSSRGSYPEQIDNANSYTRLLANVHLSDHCFSTKSHLIKVDHDTKRITIMCELILMEDTRRNIPAEKEVDFYGTLLHDLDHDCYIKIISSDCRMVAE